MPVGGAAAAAPPASRPWPRAAALALGVVYLPQLVPLFLEPLRGHDHCIAVYWQTFALIPGIFLRMVAGLAAGAAGVDVAPVGDYLDDATGWLTTIAVTVAYLAAVALLARRRGRPRTIALAALAFAGGFVALGWAQLLRA